MEEEDYCFSVMEDGDFAKAHVILITEATGKYFSIEQNIGKNPEGVVMLSEAQFRDFAKKVRNLARRLDGREA